jgi:hypothetical protein
MLISTTIQSVEILSVMGASLPVRHGPPRRRKVGGRATLKDTRPADILRVPDNALVDPTRHEQGDRAVGVQPKVLA